ncbi:DUF3243 domain-containing protein [Thermanaeromonas sp. C210]|uniref:DUF3243 domain-containing protein n=1 Tax=Thermanaeromonas sp. C210 TaxID=2731925 RepID=UPI0007499C7A|nr:DUF3243 domain-containing protein [Thermanaeromonas sp. C210]KUK12472.1 MAG: hypothetical protein XD51_0593 [Moorella sp. 60_41]GFN22466.1 hypothetical protein TAMC210_07820 [Thermanaeromonas sp. C210]
MVEVAEMGWQKWKDTLAAAINVGSMMGINEDTMGNIAYRIGNFLADKVDPANREQRVLKELWDAADEGQRRVLAEVITQMVSDGRRENKLM